ncbi:MAG: hypothetical protein P4M11_01495 [Candidatus Pacebacteria bacterium]|nr:hypothetical protein [Candidatus Paceibacterota bacterium]
MKTAIIRLGSALAGIVTVGSAFLATPAFASNYDYGYQQQSFPQNVCSSRYDAYCIIKETQALNNGYNQYQNGYGYNSYQGNNYGYNGNTWNNNYGYSYNNQYGNQNQYGYQDGYNYHYNYSYQYQY